jgi:protein ImuB
VVHASPDAQKLGVTPGMTLAHARALLPREPVVDTARPDRDAAGLLVLARFVSLHWTPTVCADGPDGLLCDISGCEHLFGGERALVRSLAHTLADLGFTVRTGVAGTVGVAWALARCARTAHAAADSGDEHAALRDLPIEGLRIPPEAATALRDIGVERVGQLLALPRATLPSRYGGELLLRLDQALGRAFEPVVRVDEAPEFSSCITLEGGTTNAESVAMAVRDALDEVCRQLERREAGLRRLLAGFARVDDPEDLELVVQVSRPTRSAAHLWTLLRPRLERLHMGYGVQRVRLTAGMVTGVAHEQGVFAGLSAAPAGTRRRDDEAFAGVLDTLVNRVGPDRVMRSELGESYRPERAFTLVPVLAEDARRGRRSRPTPLARPRPSRLYAEPVEIRVIALSPDGPVVQMSGTAFARGTSRPGAAYDEHRVVARSIGPERLAGEWWRDRRGTRDYFRVQDQDGAWLWIFRDNQTGAWYLHGEWA